MQHDTASLGALREVPFMGVIYVVAEAMKLGYRNGHPEWANLGQGQPEVGDMDGAPPRLTSVDWLPEDQAYGPLEGIPELRESVAGYYNRLYRRGLKPYRAENVAIAQGGRLALTRAMAALGSVNVGTLLPDYTAYEDMLALHLARLGVTGVRTHEDTDFALRADVFEQAVIERGLSAFVLSNPCNPTGAVIKGDELARMIEVARDRRVTVLLDEFYSHFIYGQDAPISGAPHVEDPDRDPVLLFDGLTKNFRYPGWRVGWVVGPPPMVEAIARTASAIDGGPSRISQRAALLALEPERADRETRAVRAGFLKKRDVMVSRLTEMGVRFAAPPAGTFYCWGSLEGMPPALADGMSFFRAALACKVLTVPGEFFDVNPGKLRRGESPYRRWMRFSFGPSMDVMQAGLDRLSTMVRAAR